MLDDGSYIFLLLYVDDMLIAAKSMCEVDRLKPLLRKEFDMKDLGIANDRRSTTGYVFTLSGGPVCWRSTLQSLVAMSTTEAEYMAVAEAAKEALWLKGLVKRAWFEPRRSSVAL